MEAIELHLQELLAGKPPTGPPAQPDVSDTNGQDYIPKIQSNVGYIVCAVLLNSKGDVLMKQEAKPALKGRWYLPAGKMKPGESLEEAVTREVKEDTGLQFVPSTLLAVECRAGNWYRFTFTGTVTGGSLKKESDDEHSLQAEWFPTGAVKQQDGIRLRSDDMLSLLDAATAKQTLLPTHPNILPAVKSHVRMLYRLVLVYEEDAGDRVWVLVCKDGVPHLPSAAITYPENWVTLTSHKILRDAFERDDMRAQLLGLLALEHSGTPPDINDGICFSCLVSTNDFKQVKNDRYQWLELTSIETKSAISGRLKHGDNVLFVDIV